MALVERGWADAIKIKSGRLNDANKQPEIRPARQKYQHLIQQLTFESEQHKWGQGRAIETRRIPSEKNAKGNIQAGLLLEQNKKQVHEY